MQARVRLLPGWRRLLLLGLPPLLAAAGLGSALIVASHPAAPPAEPRAIPPAAGPVAPPPPPGVLVDVTGAVVHPGLYRVPRGERVLAAITAAGGLAPDADPARLPNLAGLLKDGEQVKVPTLRSPAGSRPPPVDLNTAPLEDLEALPGFTPELAEAAIQYRTEFGGFQSTRELVDVLGMGEAQYLLARRYLRT